MSVTPTLRASGVAAERSALGPQQKPSKLGRFTPRQLTGALPVAIAVTLFIVMVIFEGTVSGSVLQSVLETTMPLILVGFGQTLVVLTGGIDLSVGGIFSLSTALLATKMTHNADLLLWLPLVMLIGVAGGVVNGLLIVRTRIQPFIVTLASWSVFDGLALLALPTEGGSVAPGLTSFLSGSVGIPKAVIILAILIAAWVIFRRTRFGMSVFAVGSSEASAHLNGLPVQRTKVIVYALSGLLASLGAIYYVGVLALSGSPVAGDPFILQSVAAVVIGGTALAGGRGSFIATVLGALSLSFIAEIVFFAGAQSFWSQFIQGLLVLAAVLLFAVVELVIRARNPAAGEEE
jgi:ribose transport system permease protein